MRHGIEAVRIFTHDMQTAPFISIEIWQVVLTLSDQLGRDLQGVENRFSRMYGPGTGQLKYSRTYSTLRTDNTRRCIYPIVRCSTSLPSVYVSVSAYASVSTP